MSINRVQNDVRQLPVKMSRGQVGGAASGIPPAALQALPKDVVGLGKQPGGKVSNLSADRKLSDLTPEELSSLKGGSSLESLAKSQGNMTIGQAQPLLRNPAALDSISKLLSKRSDLNVSDFVSKDIKGKVSIDPSYKDEETMKFLEDRSDVNPRQLSSMRSSMTKLLKNPRLGKQAAQKALKLMKDRPDLSPEQATKLMNRIGEAAGLGGKKDGGNDEMAGAAALDMFDDASKLLKKRGDMHPDRVGDLIGSVGGLTDKKDKDQASNVARGFKSAVKSLEKNPLRQPEDISKMASTMGEHFKGQGDKAAGLRMNAFEQGAKMMGDHTHLDAKGIGTMLNKAKAKNPKLKKPGQEAKLLGAFNQAQTDLASGKSTLTQMTDPGHKAAPTLKNAPRKEKSKQSGDKAKDKKTGGTAQGQTKAAPESKQASAAESTKATAKTETQTSAGPAAAATPAAGSAAATRTPGA